MSTTSYQGRRETTTRSKLAASLIPVFLLFIFTAYSANATPPTIPVTICIIDDSNHNQLRFDQNTGAYIFTDCASVSVSGSGKVTIKGSLITLTHVASDRRLTALVDQASKRANASLMLFPNGVIRTIIDRNTANDLCACVDDDDT